MKKVAILVGDITKGNGTERAVTNLANSLCTYGSYSVFIISCSSINETQPYFALNCDIVVLHLGITLNRKINYIYLKRVIQSHCEKFRFDYLLGTTHSLNCTLSWVNLAGMKRIACEHMNYAAAPWYSKIIRRFAYPKLDSVVLLTESDRKHYSFCKNTCVIPNSVPIQEQSSSCDNKVLLAIGRYTRQKGFDMLIKSFALVHSQINDWKLRIVGSGEDEQLLKQIIISNHLEKSVTLVPPTKNISKEYLNAGIFVLSSRWEGFVLVLTEAKAFGLPSVAFNCPEGPADIIINGQDGFLVEPNNIDDFSKRIVQLCNDSTLRKHMGVSAKEDILRLSPLNVFYAWNRLLI